MIQPTGRGTSEIIASTLAFLLGILFLFYIIPTQIEDYSTTLPNARTFPYALGGLFTLLSICWTVIAVIDRKYPMGVSIGNLFAGVITGILFFFMTTVMQELGYLLCGAAMVTITILFIEGIHRWKMALISGISITLLFFFFFNKLLNIELPAGLFTF
ncbi:tripartite tricarboxylate transporter TctB family protein [Desulforhopalus vacuolatus]|uniref:tripartite tricarboxylate transporter TctB family protein n=1 Tax=Desulforhopalus vacuolatus TaxID=40414 RepID=UPI0019628BE6|nr:tripartite tricarboxylate transporter TctB family protein [Desulforhopalus vacuolatus]MBM9518884.1 tripartite tricarboxylate transporter TctB family protein [Desulforhopalus vacuolatus]